MSRRFSAECLLSGRKANVEKTRFLSVIDFSNLSPKMLTFKPQENLPQSFSPESVESENRNFILSRFNISNYRNYLSVTSGCIIYVYRLLTRKVGDSMPVSLVDTAPLNLSLLHCHVVA